MTFIGLPVSTSQSVVGSILGIGILNNQLNMAGLGKVVACWVGTPLGAAIIALGILTFSRPVMETVGKKLVRLDPFSALIVVLSLALTVHFYTLVGVPVSTSQAVVGGVLGIGIIKGVNTVSRQTLRNILLAWFLTPVVACFFSITIHFVIHLHYIP